MERTNYTDNLKCPKCGIRTEWSYIRNGWYCSPCDVAIIDDKIVYVEWWSRKCDVAIIDDKIVYVEWWSRKNEWTV